MASQTPGWPSPPGRIAIAAARTVLEEGLLLRIDAMVLDELLADHPELARGVIRTLVTMLRGGVTDRGGKGR